MPFYAGFWLGLGKLAGSPSVRGALKRLLSNPQTTNELALVANSGDDALLHMVQASAKNALLPVATGRLSPEAAAKMLTDEIRTLSLAARNIASPESGLVSMFLQEAGPQLTPQAKALEAVLETEGLPAERNSPWLEDGGGPLTDGFAKAMEENLGVEKGDVVEWKQISEQWSDPALLKELSESGEKYTAENVLGVTKTQSGQLAWLEVGRSGGNGQKASGMMHILEEHETDFANQGIQKEELGDFIMEVVTNGKIVSYQGKGTGRPIFQLDYKEHTYVIAITISSNGYIVGANPKPRLR